ncbi:hypothetical protein [Niallia taxi]|uniref:hypothetical protein n=1 Tax=Niallia taxi TaxID=2499688 RepID=UPI0015F772BF|nr:hypothetical protein [Niallia taxi]
MAMQAEKLRLSPKTGIQFFVSQKDRFELYLYKKLRNKTVRNVNALMEDFEQEFASWPISHPHRYRVINSLIEEGLLSFGWNDELSPYIKNIRLTERGAILGDSKINEFGPLIKKAKHRLELLKTWMDEGHSRSKKSLKLVGTILEETAASLENSQENEDDSKGIQFFISQSERLELYLYKELYNAPRKLKDLKVDFDEAFGDWSVSKSHFYSQVEKHVNNGYLEYTIHGAKNRQITITHKGKERYFEMVKDFNPLLQTAFSRIIMLENWLNK